MEHCLHCEKDLGAELTITAVEGVLLCNTCADRFYDTPQLKELCEEINPADIGIEPASCKWCGEELESSELHKTDLGWLCGTCILAIRSRGEEIEEVE